MQSPEMGVCLASEEAIKRLLWLRQSDLWGEEWKIRLCRLHRPECTDIALPATSGWLWTIERARGGSGAGSPLWAELCTLKSYVGVVTPGTGYYLDIIICYYLEMRSLKMWSNEGEVTRVGPDLVWSESWQEKEKMIGRQRDRDNVIWWQRLHLE